MGMITVELGLITAVMTPHQAYLYAPMCSKTREFFYRLIGYIGETLFSAQAHVSWYINTNEGTLIKSSIEFLL